jgi:hypothetical protein
VAERAASHGIATVGDLRATPETRLLEIPVIGPKAVADIAEALQDRSVRSTDPIEVLALPTARTISERDSELVRMRQHGARREFDSPPVRDLAGACAADPGS